MRLEREGSVPGRGLPVLLLDLRPAGLGESPPIVLTEKVRLGTAEDPLGRRVEIRNIPVAIEGNKTVGDTLQDVVDAFPGGLGLGAEIRETDIVLAKGCDELFAAACGSKYDHGSNDEHQPEEDVARRANQPAAAKAPLCDGHKVRQPIGLLGYEAPGN